MKKLNQLCFSEYDLNEILESSKANKLVLFIGAGFSKFSETELVKIPTWSELIDELKDELDLVKENDFLKIAQLYFLKHGQNSYVKKIKSSIKNLEPSSFHKMLFELEPHYIITTNWDNLLEKTSQDIGVAYDLVSSDVDLAQSNLDKKIIKMHGDLRQNNFVFKEDDYLQYSKNFPLIENFIKGVFSTSTVVFLGFSFDDYNLKQIISWVTTISKATPKKYLIQKKYDDTQAIYLRNHGVTLLSPTNVNINYHELYSMFFNELKIISHQKELIENIITSAKLEIKKINDSQSKSHKDKLSSVNEINKYIAKRIYKFIDGKLSPLTQYKVLLPEQISNKLTNCIISYDRTGITLKSPENDLTGDYDKSSREINNRYIDNIFKESSDFQKTFYSILKKALISNVHYNSKTYKIDSASELHSEIYKKLTFLYSKDSMDHFLVNKEYDSLLNLLVSKIKHFISEKNYIRATIYMANFDDIYRRVKREVSSASSKLSSDKYKEILKNFTPFDYKNKMLDFPRELKNDLQDLVNILEFNEIYKAYYRFDVASKDNIRLSKTRSSGGFAFSQDEFTLRQKLYPYVYFILGNEILIEEYVELKKLFEFNILGSMEHYLSQEAFSVNIIDLFILIKYCDTNNLKEFSLKLINNKKLVDINKIQDRYIYIIKKYLLASLNNICNMIHERNSESLNATSADGWLNNLLIILGGVRWNQKQLKTIMNSLIPLLENRTSGIVIYESIHYFLYSNSLLYQKSHQDMLKIIDVILEKIIKQVFNGYDTHIINSETIHFIFNLSESHKYTYKNIELLKLALLKIQNYDVRSKIIITKSLLLNIKKIGSDEVSETISDFIHDDILDLPLDINNTLQDILDRLTLISYGYSEPENFPVIINEFISNNIPDKSKDPDFETFHFKQSFPELISLIISKKGPIPYQDILDNYNIKWNA